MNVLITMSGDPYIDGDDIWVGFKAIARIPNQPPFAVMFRVQYGWGSTLQQKRTAILNAAGVAKQQYEEAHGVTLPAVNQIEILGI